MDDTISRQAAIDAIHGRIFQEIVVEYPSYNTYPEYKGKPYFSIKYTENGQEFIGYGTYKPEVLSEYLKEYFMPSAQPSGKDPIEREAVVNILHDAMQGCDESEEDLIGEIVCKVDLLPSVQPEKRAEERTETHACDCISRQAAIDAPFKKFDANTGVTWIPLEHIERLPSAQPEIIRCKDCEWFRKEYGWNCIEYTVCGISPTHHPIMREEDFCSRAERRRNE